MAVAAVVLAAAGTIIYFMLPGNNQHQQQAGLTNPPANKAIIKNLTLPDGSHVLLQANSQLQYPDAFTTSTREVTLTGEAYFDVAHNPAQPFIIHAGNIKTTVLGTAFNIKAWPADKEVTITVTRGKVKVENEKGLVGILTPDQQLSINTQVNTAKQQAVNAENVLSWKNSEYTLDDMTLADAITELEVRYGTIIELAEGEKPGHCRFTASFKQAESLDYVLNVICKIYQASWQKQDGKIVINNVHCND
jgi:ferric-dicitrate binding protein FerR (iron transport regulator)